MGRQRKASKDSIRQQLELEIAALQQSLETANSNFENVSDPDLIDSCIYELNSLSYRYQYLLRQIKNLSPQAET
jgi:hypothetical protein